MLSIRPNFSVSFKGLYVGDVSQLSRESRKLLKEGNAQIQQSDFLYNCMVFDFNEMTKPKGSKIHPLIADKFEHLQIDLDDDSNIKLEKIRKSPRFNSEAIAIRRYEPMLPHGEHINGVEYSEKEKKFYYLTHEHTGHRYDHKSKPEPIEAKEIKEVNKFLKEYLSKFIQKKEQD